jgi:hypothetical protein
MDDKAPLTWKNVFQAIKEDLTFSEKVSLVVTGVTFVVLCILAWASSHYNWLLGLAVSVGGLGGLVHEVAQSNGKIAFLEIKKYDDGLYLGTLAGVLLGAVAGILVIPGYLITSTSGTELSVNMTQVAYETFSAGLSLKGVVEAAAGTPVSSGSPTHHLK